MEQLTQTENNRLNRLKSLKDESHFPTMTTTKPLIQRVTHILLRDNKDFERYLKPIAVALGPLHHDYSPDSKLQRGEESKLRMAAEFIEYSGTEEEDFYRKVKADINSLRGCYDSKQIETWSDEYLAWMFLVDGCAMLFFIFRDANDNLDELGVKDDLLAYTKLDLFLLENQLPYQLLQILIDSCNESRAEELKKSITIFINKNAISPVEQEQQKHRPEQEQQEHRPEQQQLDIMMDQTQEEREPAHLLELLWRRMTKSKKEKESDGTMSKLLKKLSLSCDKGSDGSMSKSISSNSNHSDKESDRTTSKGKSSNRNPGGKNRHYRYTFRNVKELKEKGILLKVSKTSNIRDISFQENFFLPTLRLPPITVDDFTGAKLMNLIAYEMCPDFKNEFDITSYVSFLDSLIDQEEDVRELRDAGVLYNGLGSDKAVAFLFNEISKNLVPNPKLHLDLKLRIEEHCNTAFSRHVAQLYHTYFKSPWSILALLGAILALGLTAAQTFQGI